MMYFIVTCNKEWNFANVGATPNEQRAYDEFNSRLELEKVGSHQDEFNPNTAVLLLKGDDLSSVHFEPIKDWEDYFIHCPESGGLIHKVEGDNISIKVI